MNGKHRKENSTVEKEDDIIEEIPLTPIPPVMTMVTRLPEESRTVHLKVLAITSTAAALILLIVVIVLAHIHLSTRYCSQGFFITQRDTDNPSVFDDLTSEDYRAIQKYMLSRKNLRLTPIETATVNSSYIYMIDLHMPLKDAILKYLDRGGRKPERTAKVVVVRGDVTSPRVEEYHIGPLPNLNYHRLVANPAYLRIPIPYTSRPLDQVDYRYLYPMINRTTEKLYGILKESFGCWYHNCTKGANCMLIYDVAPSGLESGERMTWFWAFRDVEGYYLHPLGLEIQIDHASTNVDRWQVVRIVYNGQVYYDIGQLIQRYNEGKVRKAKLPAIDIHGEMYSSYWRRGPKEIDPPLQGPKLTEPEGRRYQLDGQHVHYMHWDFNFRMRTSTGLQLFDIRFQGERIAHEISLQEVAVFYSGYGPSQGTSNHYDTSRHMGASSFELVRGVDCPDTAAFVDSTYFVDTGKPNHYKSNICIFEHNPGIPLRRHYTNDFKGGYTAYGGLVDYCLVVRTIANIWNYDYIFDYIFHLNGAIEVKTSATGYVQATFGLQHEEKYGNPIYNNVIADMHQHVFHFKVDLDIAGVDNRYATVNIGKETIKNHWFPSRNKTQMTFKIDVKQREQDIIDEVQLDSPKYNIIFNEFAKNKFGRTRAYRILNMAASPFLIPEADVARAATWAKYPIAVTQFKNTEEMSSSIYAQNDPYDPVVNFDRFLQDNDSLIDTDLVAWVTVGVHHIPHTEDVPSTSITGNQLSFYLQPFNFFTECPSVSSPNTVHILPSPDFKVIEINTFGTSFESYCAQRSVGPFDYFGVWGKESIRPIKIGTD